MLGADQDVRKGIAASKPVCPFGTTICVTAINQVGCVLGGTGLRCRCSRVSRGLESGSGKMARLYFRLSKVYQYSEPSLNVRYPLKLRPDQKVSRVRHVY